MEANTAPEPAAPPAAAPPPPENSIGSYFSKFVGDPPQEPEDPPLVPPGQDPVPPPAAKEAGDAKDADEGGGKKEMGDDELKAFYTELTGPEKLSQKDILDRAVKLKATRDLNAKARGEGKNIQNEFFIEWVGAERKIEDMAEMGVYSFKDMFDAYDNMKKSIDPTRIVMPPQDDLDGWQKAMEEYYDVPPTPDGYKEEAFSELPMFEGDPALKNAYKDHAYNMNISNDQLRFMADFRQAEADAREKEEAEAEARYRQENTEAMVQAYGEDFDSIMKTLASVVDETPGGKEFMEEFGKSRVASSATFWNFMLALVENDIAMRPPQPTAAISQASVGELQKIQKMAFETMSQNARDQQGEEYQKANALSLAIERELHRRGRTR